MNAPLLALAQPTLCTPLRRKLHSVETRHVVPLHILNRSQQTTPAAVPNAKLGRLLARDAVDRAVADDHVHLALGILAE